MNTTMQTQTDSIQNPPVIDPNAPPPAHPEEDKRVSAKFAALTRKEKLALQKLQAANAKEQAVTAREQALAQREARMQEFETVKSQNPIKALEMLGYNYNQLSEAMLNEGKITPEMQIGKLEQKLQAFEKTQEQKEAEARKLAEQQALEEQNEILQVFQNDIKNHVEQNKTQFPLIDLYGQANLVYASIDEHYNKTGKIVSISEACDHVEKYLEAQAEKALSVEKIRAKVLPQPQAETKQAPSWNTPKPQIKTLNNSIPPAAPSKTRSLSDDERIRRAVEKVWGNR